MIRDDIEGKHRQPHLRLGVRRRRRRPTRCSPTPRSSSTQEMLYPRVHPAPMETCGTVADMNPVTGKLHRLLDQPGAARAPHGLRAGRRHPRAQDPDHLPRHRRRLRQQGRHLPRLRARGRRLDRHRQAGEVDGGPQREPDGDVVRPRLPHDRQDRGDPRRQDPRPAGRRARRPRRVQRHRAADEVPGRLLPHLHRQLRPRRPRTARSPASTRTRRRAASPTPARSGSPRRSTWSSGWSTASPPSWTWTPPSCG